MSDYINMPKTLTAENGAKGLMSGEFKIQIETYAEDGSTEFEDVIVPWTTIKDIYAMAVKHLGEHDKSPRKGGMYLCDKHGGYGFQSDCKVCNETDNSRNDVLDEATNAMANAVQDMTDKEKGHVFLIDKLFEAIEKLKQPTD